MHIGFSLLNHVAGSLECQIIYGPAQSRIVHVQVVHRIIFGPAVSTCPSGFFVMNIHEHGKSS